VTVPNHEHRFEATKPEVVFEDGAAIFIVECDYVEITSAVTSERHDETFYGTGAECEKTRKYRFDASYIWYPDGQGAPFPGLDDEFPPKMEHAFMMIETRLAEGSNEVQITKFDPDKENGEVRVEWNDWELVYKP